MRAIVREVGLRAVVAAATLALAPPATAYEGPMHRALAEAVFVVSPAARMRVPERYLGAVYKGAEDADQPNPGCDLHGGVAGAGAAEAQRLLDYLLRTRDEKWSSNRALVLGRLLHLVADATVPDSIARGDPNAVSELFADRQVALFRERRDPQAPLRDLLAAAARDTRWADDPAEDAPARVRAAVNLGIEMVLRLSPTDGRAAGEDGGVAVFVVDRIARADVAARPEDSDQLGLSVLEWATRSSGSEKVHRLVVFNPTSLCGREVVIHSGALRWPVATVLPPHTFRKLELRTPTALNRRLTRVETRASQLCPPGSDTASTVAIRASATVAGTAGDAPDIDGVPVLPY